jgi:hypothetical protein
MKELPTGYVEVSKGVYERTDLIKKGKVGRNLCADDVRDSMPLFRSGRGGSSPTSALQLSFRSIPVKDACALNAIWHSRFPHIHWSNVCRNQDYVCFVAEFDDIAYAVAIWSSPVAANRMKHGKTSLELRRMAIDSSAPKNTASRMLGWMRRWIEKNLPHITHLVSYQDTDVHSGTIYKASGWHVAATNQGASWTHAKRTRNKEQSLSPKIRWELETKYANGSLLIA